MRCHGRAVLFIFMSRLPVDSAGSGVHRVQVLSGFSVRLLCFVQVCQYGCMYFLAAVVLVCVDVIVM